MNKLVCEPQTTYSSRRNDKISYRFLINFIAFNGFIKFIFCKLCFKYQTSIKK
jgi:hypothetical protein